MQREADSNLALELEASLLALDRSRAEQILSAVAPDRLVVERLLCSALEEIGRRWESGDAALSQVYMAGRICEELVSSFLAEDPAPPAGAAPRVALAVLHDRHTLGKTMVRSALRAHGIDFLDYGHGLEPEDLAERVTRDGIEVLLLSVLMLNSALRIRELVDLLQQRGAACKVVVGGAPFRLDPALWREVGAFATGLTASEAPALVRRLIEHDRPAATQAGAPSRAVEDQP